MRYWKYILALLVLFSGLSVKAQVEEEVIQFSGVVVSEDSLNPVPFTNVIIANSGRGTMTDVYGYFSFVAEKGDSILFSSVGYRRANFVIPDTLEENKYSLIQILKRDTIELEETVVYPWPTFSEFKQAFLEMEVPETDVERAEQNLAQAEMNRRMEAMPASPSENFKIQMQRDRAKLYYAGQSPPVNIFNPFAWSKFIEAWKRGDFKNTNNE